MGRAESLTHYHQTGSRGHLGRQHQHREARNYICAHMRRTDPVTRRFIQYLTMQTSTVCILVRDGKNGHIVVKPPEEQLWLVREKAGIGRASKKEWNVIQEVGQRFFEEMDQKRAWHFGHNDFYDVYMWDFLPGDDFETLYRSIHEVNLPCGCL
jgi:hypothetical protein